MELLRWKLSAITEIISNFILQLNSAVLYDAVFLFNKALEALNARNIDYEARDFIDPLPIFCNDGIKYQAGSNITSIIREVNFLHALLRVEK